MGYHELLRALEDEVERQIRGIEADAEAACRRLDETVSRDLAARRETALAAESRRLDEEALRATSHARFEQARALLVEQRRLLAQVREEAERRLPELDMGELGATLAGEIAAELGDGPVEFRVAPGREAAFRDALARRHPELAGRAAVRGIEGVTGGVVAAVDNGRRLLDNSLPSRLEKAWQQLEGELAAELFGGVTDGRGM